jgi:hypothetical protein
MVETGGAETWVYRKPAAGRGVANTYLSIVSLGQLSGADSNYADILTVSFAGERVTSVRFEANVAASLIQR